MHSGNGLASFRRVTPLLDTTYCHPPVTVTTSFISSEAGFIRDQKYLQHKSSFSSVSQPVSQTQLVIGHKESNHHRFTCILMDKATPGTDFFFFCL